MHIIPVITIVNKCLHHLLWENHSELALSRRHDFSSSDQTSNITYLHFNHHSSFTHESSSCLWHFFSVTFVSYWVNQVKYRMYIHSILSKQCKYSFSHNNSMLFIKTRIQTVTFMETFTHTYFSFRFCEKKWGERAWNCNHFTTTCNISFKFLFSVYITYGVSEYWFRISSFRSVKMYSPRFER